MLDNLENQWASEGFHNQCLSLKDLTGEVMYTRIYNQRLVQTQSDFNHQMFNMKICSYDDNWSKGVQQKEKLDEEVEKTSLDNILNAWIPGNLSESRRLLAPLRKCGHATAKMSNGWMNGEEVGYTVTALTKAAHILDAWKRQILPLDDERKKRGYNWKCWPNTAEIKRLNRALWIWLRRKPNTTGREEVRHGNGELDAACSYAERVIACFVLDTEKECLYADGNANRYLWRCITRRCWTEDGKEST